MIEIKKLSKFIDKYLHLVIDELHPMFEPISDEEIIEYNDTYATSYRDFLHKNGQKFRIKWTVYFGTPETVQTVFHKVQNI